MIIQRVCPLLVTVAIIDSFCRVPPTTKATGVLPAGAFGRVAGLGFPTGFSAKRSHKWPLYRIGDRQQLAGLRQRGFQFARRIAVIERGPTKPLVFKLDD